MYIIFVSKCKLGNKENYYTMVIIYDIKIYNVPYRLFPVSPALGALMWVGAARGRLAEADLVYFLEAFG